MQRGRVEVRGPRRDGEKSDRRRATVLVLATFAVLSLGAVATEPARAGTYVMRNCDVPGHRNSPMHPWEAMVNVSTPASVVDGCIDGRGVAVTLSDAQQLTTSKTAGVTITKPPTLGSAISFVKVVLWYAARLSGSGSPLRFVTAYHRPDHGLTWGVANTPPGSENLIAEQQLSPDATFYAIYLQCGFPIVNQTEPCVADNRVPLQVRGMEVTLREDVPPAVAPPTGSLLDGGPQTGLRTLSYAASDSVSGLSRVDVLLDETVVASRDLTPRCRYDDFAVCPTSDDETLDIDTRAVPNGSYELAVRVRDAAGNEQVVRGERLVDVANESPVGASSVLPYAIVANFKGSSRSKLTVAYGRRVSLRGRLTQGLQPVRAGIPIEVMERPDRRGAVEKTIRTVMTKADGSFSIGLATSRPSRVVRLAYRPAGGDQVVSRALKLRVKAASRMRASLRGRVVHFNGTVLSRPFPKRGKRIMMEGRSPGSAWTPFKTLRTDTKGRFSGTYRLRVRRPGVRLKIRTIVPSESGYGYLSSRSRAVTLRVR
jgi:hypothetical protein